MSQALMLKATKTGLGFLSKISPKTSLNLAERLFSTPKSKPFTQKDLNVLAKGTTSTLESGLVVTTWGNCVRCNSMKGNGAKVLLVHGWQRHRASLSGFIEPLLAKGKQVIAFDAPAHGESKGKRANPIIYSEAILEVAHEFGPIEGIIAHSMGGGASVIALKEGLEVERLVLLATATNWPYQLRLVAEALGIDAKAFIQQIEKNSGKTMEDINAAEISKQLSQAALLFHDPEDARVPYKDSQVLAENWSNAELITVENLGHGGIIKNPEVIQKAVEYIGG